VKAFTLIALGLAIAAMGIYVADADDAPGAAVGGLLLILAGVVLGIREPPRLALAAVCRPDFEG